MPLKILSNDDLERAPVSAGWKSLGDDPAFRLSFPVVRKKFVVVHIAGGEDAIDPKIYVNRGRGFRERDAVPLHTGRYFAILADIGHIGSICSLRIDPASFPTDFTFDVKAFSSRRAAARHMSDFVAEHDGTQQIDLGRLPRFWVGMPQLPFRKPKHSTTAQYVEAHHQLAAQLPPISPRMTAGTWLSIVVPVYNAPARYLDDLVKSFESQEQSGVELILSDDGSTSAETRRWYRARPSSDTVRIILNEKNGGIAVATNSGLEKAQGQWVAFLDHDDLIAPHALKMIRHTLEQNPQANFLYTDELVVDDKLKPTGLMLKPAYDPVLLTGVNYINHFSVYRRERLEEFGFLRTGYDGSQDYDLLLRYLEQLPAETVIHLPYPAYWWRRTGQTYSRKFMDAATANARKAIEERFLRQRQAVRVAPALTETLHHVLFERADDTWPKISVVIPSKDNFSLISRILRDLFERTDYPDFEVLVIDNGTTDPGVLDLYGRYSAAYPNFSARISPEPFNFSRSVNRGLSAATGKHHLILNNDIEVIDDGWLKEMVSCLEYENTGIVGAKLLYPNDRIQHAGVIIGFGGLAGHWYLNKPRDFGGPMNRLHVRNSMTCVTGAVMLVSGVCAAEIGLFDEENFAVAYNDVDYCLRAHKAGYRIVWTPFACLYHHESASRGSDKSGESRKRFDVEKDNLRRLHATPDFRDRTINPGYSRDKSEPRILAPVVPPVS
jgi:GT2 family glycosyltransferase